MTAWEELYNFLVLVLLMISYKFILKFNDSTERLGAVKGSRYGGFDLSFLPHLGAFGCQIDDQRASSTY